MASCNAATRGTKVNIELMVRNFYRGQVTVTAVDVLLKRNL